MNTIDKVKEIFLAALDITAPMERRAYLDSTCGGDEVLRRDVEELLGHHERAGLFMSAMGNRETEPAAPPWPAEHAGMVIGRYKLLEKIGEGGMGTVWTAQQTEPVRRLVAVKLIKQGMASKDVLARFEAERQALAMMDHPHIAKVLDAGSTSARVARASGAPSDDGLPPSSESASSADSGWPYFVMDLVKGVPITRYCDENRLTPRERLQLFIPVGQAIQHAHQKGIIHRDIKPSNVLVALYDQKPTPKVIDFGVAKAVGRALTEATLLTGFGVVVGTVEYMSPEQASFNQLDVDTRSDIYSLGVLLYELLTGTTPLDRERLGEAPILELLQAVREQDAPTLSQRLSTTAELAAIAAKRGIEPFALTQLVRGDLNWIVMKALEKDRNRRYATANDLAQDLERYLADEPVLAGPPSRWYRLRKFVRRNRGAVLAALLLGAMMLAGMSGTSYGLIRAVQGERLAKTRLLQITEEKEHSQRAEAAAKSAEAETEAFSNWLVLHVLSAARPAGVQRGLGVDATVAQAIESAEADIEKRFAGRPKAEATARHAVGVTWRNLGRFAGAEVHLRRALELRRKHLEPDHPDTLVAQNSLGVLLLDAGRIREAIDVLEDVTARRTARLGPDDDHTLTSLSNLAGAYDAAGDFARARDLAARVYDRREAVLGPGHASTLEAMSKLAYCHLRADRADLALPLANQAYERGQARLGPEHEVTAACAMVKCQVHVRLQQPKEALAIAEGVLRDRQARYGAAHPQTLNAQSEVASIHANLGDKHKARDMFQEIVDRGAETLGEDHPAVMTAATSLAVLWAETSSFPSEAVLLLEKLRELRTRRSGSDHPATQTVRRHLARLYLNTNRAAEAVPLAEQALERQREQLGAEHADTLDTLRVLADAYAAVGRTGEAVALYEEELRQRTRKSGPDHVATLQCRAALVRAYRAAGQSAEAGRLLEEERRRFQGSVSADPKKAVVQLKAQAAAMSAAKRDDDAVAPLEQALALAKAHAFDHVETLEITRALGWAYERSNRPREAIPHFEACVELSRARFAPDHPQTLKSLSDLAWTYDAAGRLDDAVKTHRENIEQLRARHGPGGAATIHALAQLHFTLRQAGRSAEAIPDLEAALQARTSATDVEAKEVHSARFQLAMAHLDSGQYARAEAVFRQYVARDRGAEASVSDLQNSLIWWGISLIGEKKHLEAERALRECLEIRRKFSPGLWATFNAMARLGVALAGQKKFTEAEAFLLQGYEGMLERRASIPRQALDPIGAALADLVRLYEDWDKPESAARWRLELQARQAAKAAALK